MTQRQHGNAKRLPSNALKMEDNAFVAHFLLNYAETHGMYLPGLACRLETSVDQLLDAQSLQ